MGATESSQSPVKLRAIPVEGQTGTAEDPACPTGIKHNKGAKRPLLLKETSVQQRPRKVPKGLIGTKSTAQVKIEGKSVNCLLDTGSQVTTIPLSFFQQHLSQCHPMKSLFDFLEIEGANGQSVPYLGYVELNINFPKEFLGVAIEMPTLALVVPDVHAAPYSLVLIGTNTLDVMYDLYCDIPEKQQPTRSGYKAVLKILELRQRENKSSELGLVKMHRKAFQMVPAGQTVVLEGCVITNGFTAEKCAVLEHPSSSPLPGGLLVKTCLVDLPAKRPYKVPVVVVNEPECDIVIPQSYRGTHRLSESLFS